MRKIARFWRHPDALAILFLIAWPLAYFWQVTLGRGVWYSPDIQRIYLPFGAELNRALNDGRLPLWTAGILAGFPLLAEGHVSALYPVYDLIFRILPAHYALSYGTLLHLAWGACGMYAYVRDRRLFAPSALLAGFLYSFNAFAIEKVYYTPILVTSAWLPWLLFLQLRFQRARQAGRRGAGLWFLATAGAVGLQLVSGFPQMAFMSLIALVCFAFLGELFGDASLEQGQGVPRGWIRRLTAAALWTILPIALGCGLAAVQLLPTLELIGFSVRSGGMDYEFVTSYSLPPAFLTELVWPFSQTEPFEHTNGNLAYLGLAPLALAATAPWLKRDRRTAGYAAFTLAALALALGDLNPVYQILYRIPIFDLFRTPARYLFLYVFGANLLAATGFEYWLNRLRESKTSRRGVMLVVAPFALATLVVFWLAQTQPMEFWLGLWRGLPIALALAAAGIFWLAWQRRIGASMFSALVIGLTVLDLAAYAPPVVTTPHIIQTPDYVESVPRSLAGLKEGRVFTDLDTVPTIPALRGSLYPNSALVYGRESVQAQSPLVYARHQQYLAAISPAMLDALNVRYWLVPLEPRAIARAMGHDTRWTLDLVEHPARFAAVSTRVLELVSFTEQAQQLAPGTAVAKLTVEYEDGQMESRPIRVGMETADWDSARRDAKPVASGVALPVAHAFTGFLRSSGATFEGRAFLARYDLGANKPVVSVRVEDVNPDVRLTLEEVSLVDDQGHAVLVSQTTHKSSLRLVYMSDTVAVWENPSALPRAFMVHSAERADDDTTLARMSSGNWQPERTVFLNDGAEPADVRSTGAEAADQVLITGSQPERVELSVKTDAAGYLVMSDTWYSGWQARLDGRPVEIRRANLLSRAVAVDPGEHVLVFEYQSRPFQLGCLVAALSLAAAVGIAFVLRRRPGKPAA